MSDKKVRQPVRPRNVTTQAAKTKPVVAPVATAPTVVAKPEVVPVVVAKPEVAPTVVESSAQPPKVKTPKPVLVNISAARSRRHLDKLNLNAKLLSVLSEHKKVIAEYKLAAETLATKKVHVLDAKTKNSVAREATDMELTAAEQLVNKLKPSINDHEMKAAALSAEKIRFSSNASTVLSIICEEVVLQLAEHTMEKALNDKKKIIQVEHLHEEGVDTLSLYPLFSQLPLFKSTGAKLALRDENKKMAQRDAALLAAAEKEWKLKYGVQAPKKKKHVEDAKEEAAEPVEEPAADVHVSTDEEEEDDDSKTSFRFYIQRVCVDLKSRNDKYKVIRISTEIRSYLSTLVVELIQRLSNLVFLTADSMKNKTITDSVIMRTVEYLLIDGHKQEETIELVPGQVKDPESIKKEIAKRKEAHANGVEYDGTPLSKIPTVEGLEAVRKVSYPTSGYAALAAAVEEKCKLLECKKKESD